MPEEDVWCSLEGYLKSIGQDHATVSGVPTWLALVAVVLIIFLSHALVNVWKTSDSRRLYPTFNLLRWGPLNWLVHRPGFPLMLQSVALFCFLLILAAGLFGSPKHNIAPVLTWTWWWALLIFLVLGLGQAFCAICPWEALSSLVTALSPRSRIKQLGFERPWPKWARTVVPATLLFVLLTWFELGQDVTHSPSMTATMALVMAGMAILAALFFEKRVFCRSLCLVGRVTGLYSLFSPIELRRQSAEVCLSCTSKACYHGTETSTGCPTNLFPGALRENTHCTLCTECIRACPHDNIGIQLRPPAADLTHKIRFQWDEAFLAIVLLSLTSFHGFTMTPLWGALNQWLRAETGWGPTPIFTLLMSGMLVAPIILFTAGARIAAKLGGTQAGHRPVPSERQNPTTTAIIHSTSRGIVQDWLKPERRTQRSAQPALGSTFSQLHGHDALGFQPSGASTLTMPSLAEPPVAESSPGGSHTPRTQPGQSPGPWTLFKAFAYALIPVALFYHLAHNCMHFFLEAGSLVPLLSDPFGWGWNLFGTAGQTYGPLLSLRMIWTLQILCIVVGHVYGVIVADRIARRLYPEPSSALRGLVPLLGTMVLYSCFSVWLISQPMDMRTGM